MFLVFFTILSFGAYEVREFCRSLKKEGVGELEMFLSLCKKIKKFSVLFVHISKKRKEAKYRKRRSDDWPIRGR